MGERAAWRNIFLHELGHFLGFEHPWDNDDDDGAVDGWSDSHVSARMGYKEHLDGNNVWYSKLDIEALEKIWGKGEWPSLYKGVTPGSSFGLSFNKVGVLSSADATIYVCLRVFTNGLSSSVNGISQFDMGLEVVSLSEVTVQVTKFREFNASGVLNEHAQTPDCSGIFETTTGVYTDIIQTNTSLLETTWSLIDPTNLILKLDSFKELTAN